MIAIVQPQGNGAPFDLPDGWPLPRVGDGIVHPDTLMMTWVVTVTHDPSQDRVVVYGSPERP